MKIINIIFLSLMLLISFALEDYFYILMALFIFIAPYFFQFILFIYEELKRASDEKNKRRW